MRFADWCPIGEKSNLQIRDGLTMGPAAHIHRSPSYQEDLDEDRFHVNYETTHNIMHLTHASECALTEF